MIDNPMYREINKTQEVTNGYFSWHIGGIIALVTNQLQNITNIGNPLRYQTYWFKRHKNYKIYVKKIKIK